MKRFPSPGTPREGRLASVPVTGPAWASPVPTADSLATGVESYTGDLRLGRPGDPTYKDAGLPETTGDGAVSST